MLVTFSLRGECRIHIKRTKMVTEDEIHKIRKQPETLEDFRKAQGQTMTEDDILTAIRRGIDTRHRLLIAFPKQDPDDVRHIIATLVYRGLVKTVAKRLKVV